MGLPASGKSTLAKRVENRVREMNIKVENLDGDEVRKNLHPDLGFTREERGLNNRRTAFVCKLLNRNDIATVTAMITPFRDAQQHARKTIDSTGKFILIYVKCPVEVCAERDPKGLYEKAKAGKIENFTGINHPFQEPIDPEIIVDTVENDIDECVNEIMSELHAIGVFDNTPEGNYEFNISKQEEQSIKDRLQNMGYFE